jgi:hypothetical protein
MDHSFKDWTAEDYPPMVVHNPPEFSPQPAPQKAVAESDEITVGRLLFHLLLLGLTVLTTTSAVGLFMLGGLIKGAVYSFTVLSILGAHEMGHYIACRWYGVRAAILHSGSASACRNFRGVHQNQIPDPFAARVVRHRHSRAAGRIRLCSAGVFHRALFRHAVNLV